VSPLELLVAHVQTCVLDRIAGWTGVVALCEAPVELVHALGELLVAERAALVRA